MKIKIIVVFIILIPIYIVNANYQRPVTGEISISHGPMGYTTFENLHFNFHILYNITKKFNIGGFFGIGLPLAGTISYGFETNYLLFSFVELSMSFSFLTFSYTDNPINNFISINPGVGFRLIKWNDQKGNEHVICISFDKAIIIHSIDTNNYANNFLPFQFNIQIGYQPG